MSCKTMSEAEKQEGQKTVVSFITGLLIGGLLVWVFSSSPESTPTTETDDATTEESTNSNTNSDAPVSESTTITVPKQTATPPAPVTAGKGTLTVTDQTAGNIVTLGATTYPNENGWIVVRDYKDNVSGKILGASRFATKDGLLPTTVNLLRPTIKGSEYQVQFYTESGDKKFGTPSDVAVVGGETTFKAN